MTVCLVQAGSIQMLFPDISFLRFIMTQLMIIKGGEVGKKGDEGSRAVLFVSQRAINDVLLCLCLLISSLKSVALS